MVSSYPLRLGVVEKAAWGRWRLRHWDLSTLLLRQLVCREIMVQFPAPSASHEREHDDQRVGNAAGDSSTARARAKKIPIGLLRPCLRTSNLGRVWESCGFE